MGSIRFFFSPYLIFLLIFSLPLYAQSADTAAPGALVGTEIQNIEKTLGTPALSDSRRHEALVNLARLYELSGNIEGAATAWTTAAAADPANRDDLALVKGAACYAAMGEWEKAEEAVKTVLLTGWNKQTLLRARLLAAQIGAFKSGSNADGNAALIALLDDSDYGEFKASICYTLWKITGAGIWKDRLLAEFPRSPEARIAAGTDTTESGAVSAAPTAMWLLIPGREGIAAASAVAPSIPAAALSTPAVAETGAANGTALQTGLFSREGNAQAMAERLKTAGFVPVISRRTVNGAEYWAVNVPAGSDMGTTILRLKNVGVESFPVFN
jgi:tetratricopeptide (TPR) repeat protein